MRTLYLECNMGAAGDMLLAALLELHPAPDAFIEKLNTIGLPHVQITAEKASKCGITGTHVHVRVHGAEEHEGMHAPTHAHTHAHSGLHEIEALLQSLNISQAVREHAVSVYRLLAEAEGQVHGCSIEHIHFHEVGTLDAVADIVGTCMLIEALAPETILASPIHVGSGQVRCAHGILPVPAPATAQILRGVPIYGGEIQDELCTPTGAALVKHFASAFVPLPVMRLDKIGYGVGTKAFEKANVLRAMLGETQAQAETVVELCCNIDDMTGEEIGFATEQLLRAGALDVFTTPVGMKKSRPGILLTCLCREERKEEMTSLLFKHTSTLGIREHTLNRYTLERRETTLRTNYGNVRAKEAFGYGVRRVKAEYADLAKLAEENGIGLSELKELSE